jgi:hypothetical protein
VPTYVDRRGRLDAPSSLPPAVLRMCDPFSGSHPPWTASEIWTGDVGQQLARIEEGWKAVGKPDIGDVVWFVGQRAEQRPIPLPGQPDY